MFMKNSKLFPDVIQNENQDVTIFFLFFHRKNLLNDIENGLVSSFFLCEFSEYFSEKAKKKKSIEIVSFFFYFNNPNRFDH